MASSCEDMSARGHTSTCKLIIDARERHVTRHAVEFGGIPYEIKQITIGDYAIITPTGKMLATIERKTYEDFGASLKDGRYSNKEKMLALQRATGCSVILLLEGEEFPAPTKTYARIPYAAIESAMFHMQVRDGFQVIRTADTQHTAQLLVRLVKSLTNLCGKEPMDSILESRVDVDGVAAANAANAVAGGGDDDINNDETAPADLLTAKFEKSTRDVARAMWSKFRGISVESSDEFLAKWSIADLAAGTVAAEIGAMKTAGGRKVSKNVIAAVVGCDRALEAKILAETPGISIGTARKLLANVTLGGLIASGVDSLAAAVVTKNGVKLGPAKAARVFECLCYKHPGVVAVHN